MKRRSQGRGQRAAAPYTKYKKVPYHYPDWIAQGHKPPPGSIQSKLEEVARRRMQLT